MLEKLLVSPGKVLKGGGVELISQKASIHIFVPKEFMNDTENLRKWQEKLATVGRDRGGIQFEIKTLEEFIK